ncbi:hypothetical protein QBC34DRAFT_337518 [Podospora aff. communis PSN243]|uniref:Rhodopsin domain-containing protein n=1 Tax=Podospora aff. communis PSN243 TaxID=3040156 RepID=A0AAV9G4X5_9PEZI|nr:hypothetical protein QBC34DRAFT_337518 [Podospora aff. communis PSN243]
MLGHAARDIADVIPSIDELLKNYDITDKSSLTSMIWNVNITFIVLVSVVMVLRLYTRAWITHQFFIDDVLAIFASLFILVSSATALVATNYGLGKHVWNIPWPYENIINTVKTCVQLMYVAHVFYAAGTAFTKLSIITSYLRIFPHDSLRIILYVTAVVCTGIGISAIFVTIFQCTPVHAAWDFTIPGSKCIPFVHFLYANAAISTLADVVLVVAPLPFFWSLNLPLRQRLVICVLFGVGFIALTASVVRIVFLRDVQGLDVTYYLVSPLNMTIIECSLGIICISIPPMRPLFKKLAPGLLTSYISRHTGVSRSRAGASKLFSSTDGVSSAEQGVRVRKEVRVTVENAELMERMGREVDKQLARMEIEMDERRKRGDSEIGLVFEREKKGGDGRESGRSSSDDHSFRPGPGQAL